MAPPKGFGPYVPCSRLIKILDEYKARLGITDMELAREIAANLGENEEAWFRRLYSWRSGESETCRFDTADRALTSLYLLEHWYTDLYDIYQAA